MSFSAMRTNHEVVATQATYNDELGADELTFDSSHLLDHEVGAARSVRAARPRGRVPGSHLSQHLSCYHS